MLVEVYYGGSCLGETGNNEDEDPKWEVSTSAAQIIQNVLKYNEPVSAKKMAEPKKQPAKEKEVVLRVPMCCMECEDTIVTMLKQLTGVKTIECDIYKKKVIVKGNAVVPADVLRTCKKIFKKSAMWE